MRRGFNNGWMNDENDNLIAINLGSDFTAEHEWGIKDLYEILGVENDENVLGIERRRTKNPKMEGVILIEENKNNAALVVVRPYEVKWLAGKKINDISRELSMNKEEELVTAWSGGDLGIRVHRPVNIKKLKKIYNAIQNKDAAIWLGGGHVFQNAGLCIGIISQIPEENKRQMYEADLDRQKLMAASAATGIKERIDAVNEAYYKTVNRGYDPPCGYYALSPSWINGDQKSKSKYPVMYWLNPREQQKNNYGWYTVEALDLWIKGEGPIVAKKKRHLN